jgi:ribosomal-protein-alanine N-acetyltransferase
MSTKTSTMTNTTASNAKTATGGLTVRPMAEADLPSVIALDRASHLTPWTEANFRDALAAGNLCVVAERDGAIVGCAILQMAAGEADLLTLAVTPALRRAGIGREMLREVTKAAATYGATAIFLEVRASNAAAIDLYREAGFEEVGSRKAYYERGDDREDAVTMRLGLGL